MFRLWKRSKKSEFEELTLPHLDALYNTALRLTHSESEAEDLIQETFLKAFRFFHRFERGTHIKAWLFKIMTNTFINQYRKQQRDREVYEDWDWDHLMGSDVQVGDSEQTILDRFVSDQVMESLQQIPVDFRTVVLLADLEDFSYKEIAEIVGCPIGTVMSRLYRGRRLLRKLLAEYAVKHGYISKEAAAEEGVEVSKTGKVTQLETYRQQKAAAS
ncbi:MAG: sigma-70 family RNA polymerase sigma factor [Deltaproteobacteria bacterium]|nr:MAG: sigma-70 family RNA polymerase sigma factor [Deltaproteobacteria bacterium]